MDIVFLLMEVGTTDTGKPNTNVMSVLKDEGKMLWELIYFGGGRGRVESNEI